MAPTNVCNLPSEVIHHILFYIEPTSLPTIELVSRQFAELANQPLIWQQHCRFQFRYWNIARNMKKKFADNVAITDWKEIYLERYQTDRDVSRAIDSILSTQTSRIQKSAQIVRLGHEAKDTLLRHCNVADDAVDVLARRYHSRAVLGSLHHSLAVQRWTHLQNQGQVPLEEALAAFDMFVFRNEEEDFGNISACLDRIAQDIRKQCPRLADQTLRQQAAEVAKYMRRNNFKGVRHVDQYHELPNNFIGLALRDEEHQTLPLVQVAIYCCVAQRLGLDAQPCAFPMHVLAIIKAPDGHDLDGRSDVVDREASSMYMDPWRSSDETPKEDLVQRLQTMKADPSEFTSLLGPSSTVEIVYRTARNICNSVQMLSQNTGVRGHFNLPSTPPGVNDAFYGALWALLLLSRGQGDRIVGQPERFLPDMLHYLDRDFPLDLDLFQENALPLFQAHIQYEQLRSSLRHKLTDDDTPRKRKPRSRKTQENVHYKVGQVFRHKRYNYNAITTGWDAQCEASEAWIAQMNVRSLPGGRHQAFYHAMVEDNSVRYVAEENIQIVKSNAVAPDLMALAGQHFKRWDPMGKAFVSNIRDEYPDD